MSPKSFPRPNRLTETKTRSPLRRCPSTHPPPFARAQACSAQLFVQSDAEDASTRREVAVVGPVDADTKTQTLETNVTCLIPGMVLTTFTVVNPSDAAIFVRAGAPSLPWLVVAASDRNGFSVAARAQQKMAVIVDSSVYDNKNDVAEWPVGGGDECGGRAGPSGPHAVAPPTPRAGPLSHSLPARFRTSPLCPPHTHMHTSASAAIAPSGR